MSLDEARVIIILDEADLVAVGLRRHVEAQRFGARSHLSLGQSAYREHRVRELLLRQREEEVSLVLIGVGAALEQPPPVTVALDPCVVPRRHAGGAEALGAVEERGELQVAVAVGARHRRAARGVLADEVRDDGVLELALEVQDVVRDADRLRHAARIVEVVERAAAAESLPVAPLVVELHGQADHLVTLLGEQGRGDRGVYAA